MKRNKTLLSLAISLMLGTGAVSADYGRGNSPSNSNMNNFSPIKHVLLISVDGLHQGDLDWFVKNNPASTLAAMVNNGVLYNNAATPFPSDSFPGMVGQVTGGNPATTGVYYDDEYSRGLYPQGTTDCTKAVSGCRSLLC